MDSMLKLIMDLEFIGIIIMCIVIIDFKKDSFFYRCMQVLILLTLFAVTGIIESVKYFV